MRNTFDKTIETKGMENSVLFRNTRNPFSSVLRYALITVVVFACLGLPAILFSESFGNLGKIDLTMLPNAAKYLMIALLPVTQFFAEIPWYYGYSLPKMEKSVTAKTKKPVLSAILSVFIVAAAFALQHAFMPFAFDLRFIVMNGIAMFPLVLLIGFTIRIFPKLTPVILVLHFLMAVNVSLASFR
jgi:hypothetical protein